MTPAELAAKTDKPIVLLGMMGAGKSALGVRLAEALGLHFADADAEIEKAAQMSIAEIFEKHGEAAFRDGERRVIKRLLDAPPHILALGGGAFINDETRALVREKAVSVWLDVGLDELVARVERKPNKRPLLIGQDVRAKLAALLATRGPIYATADLRVDVGGGSHEEAVARLIETLTARAAAVIDKTEPLDK